MKMIKLILMLASLFLAVNVASATPSQKVDFSSFSKTDSQFLFDGNTNAIALSSQEMKDTEGEWFWFAFRFGYSAYRWTVNSGGFAGVTAYNGWNTFRRWW